MIAFAPLTAQERALLLRLARATLNGAVAGEPPPRPRAFAEAAGATLSPPLLERRGAFVTLQRHGRLRGCIGDIVGTAPLCEAVIANTLAAAFRDPRFLPLTADELPGLTLEISALTPLRPVADWSGIEVPRHGVVLTHGHARGGVPAPGRRRAGLGPRKRCSTSSASRPVSNPGPGAAAPASKSSKPKSSARIRRRADPRPGDAVQEAR
ncbi:MAG: AmmeMemoRadiSam system protein A [bacterium]|nr:AmmeMemoRadiSam system protein A [bacterium]